MVRRDQEKADVRRPALSMNPVQLRWLIGLLVLTQADRWQAAVYAPAQAPGRRTASKPWAQLEAPHSEPR